MQIYPKLFTKFYGHGNFLFHSHQASEYYLAQLREAIGNEHFHNLLDLYPGSALSIIIDTTGSMTYEIEAVKEKSREIVEKSHPDYYVLVPYADPCELAKMFRILTKNFVNYDIFT